MWCNYVSDCVCVGLCVSGHVMCLLFIVGYVTTVEYGFRPHARLKNPAPMLIKITKIQQPGTVTFKITRYSMILSSGEGSERSCFGKGEFESIHAVGRTAGIWDMGLFLAAGFRLYCCLISLHSCPCRGEDDKYTDVTTFFSLSLPRFSFSKNQNKVTWYDRKKLPCQSCSLPSFLSSC